MVSKYFYFRHSIIETYIENIFRILGNFLRNIHSCNLCVVDWYENFSLFEFQTFTCFFLQKINQKSIKTKKNRTLPAYIRRYITTCTTD